MLDHEGTRNILLAQPGLTERWEQAMDELRWLREVVSLANPRKSRAARVRTWHREAAWCAERVWEDSGLGEPTRSNAKGAPSNFQRFARRWLHLLGVGTPKTVDTALRPPTAKPRELAYEEALKALRSAGNGPRS